jgi:hypothetical protein
MVMVGEDSTTVSPALLCLSLWPLCPFYVPASDMYFQLNEGRYTESGAMVYDMVEWCGKLEALLRLDGKL